ncbi:MAG TPA: hypothetical protein VFE78_06015, partial [Gemmataceae bacterium]|nr:hypothetical protein [Gemmataceae bacterium]
QEAEQAAAAGRAAAERKRQQTRALWQQKRDALHTRLVTEEQALQMQMQKLRGQLAAAAARLRAEVGGTDELRKQTAAQRQRVRQAEEALAGVRASAGAAAAQTEAERKALARMTADLLQLERALVELKAARERERQTYSVIPYRGRRGESRRPLYVECGPAGVVFHPERLAMSPAADPDAVRAEVERRVARQRDRVVAASGTAPETPYLMLLVRPDGISNYYLLQKALHGLTLDFGYEFIDPDWVLDFPATDEGAVAQPWMSVAQPPAGPRSPPGPTQPRGAPVAGLAAPGPGPGMGGPGGRGGGLGTTGGPFGAGGGTGFGPPGPGGLPGAGSGWGGVGGGSGAGVRGYSGRGMVAGPPGAEGTGNGFGGPGTDRYGGLGGGGSAGSGLAASGTPGSGGGVGGPGTGGGGNGPGLSGTGTPGTVAGGGGAGSAKAGSAGGTGAGGSGAGPGGGGNGAGGSGPGSPIARSQPVGLPPVGLGAPSKGGPYPATAGTAGAPGAVALANPSAGPSGSGVGPPGGSGGGGVVAAGPTGSGQDGVGAAAVPRPQGGPYTGQGGGGGATGAPGPGGGSPSGPTANGPASPSSGNPPGSRPGGAPGTAAAQVANGSATPAQPGDVPGPAGPPGDGTPAPATAPRGVVLGGGGDGGPARPEDEALARFAPPVLAGSRPKGLPPARRPVPLRPAQLHGTRPIFLECQADAVVLLPARREFPVSALTREPAGGPLVQAVRLALERQRAARLPDDPPLRPQIVFLVRPDGVRTYHLTYPLLGTLPAAQMRRNLHADEDVFSAMEGP